MTSDRDELRATPRNDEPVEVQVMGPNSLDEFHARNVSTSGIGIYSPDRTLRCDPDQEVELVITLPHERTFLARGIIIHHSQSGVEGHHFGLRFTEIAPEHRETIRKYIRSITSA